MAWLHNRYDRSVGLSPIKEAVRVVRSPDESSSRLTNEIIRHYQPGRQSTVVTFSRSLLQTSAATMVVMDEGGQVHWMSTSPSQVGGRHAYPSLEQANAISVALPATTGSHGSIRR